MTKLLLIVLFILSSISSIGQNTVDELNGRWELVSMSDNEMYYNFKKDSLSFMSPELLAASENQMVISNTKQSLSFLKNLSYTFFKQGLLEISEIDSTKKFHYYIESINNKTILKYYQKSNIDITEYYITIKNSLLTLLSTKDQFTMIFERK